MTNDEAYSAYLRSRSLRSFLYRRWWLYPRLSRYLTGRVLDVGCGIGDMLRYRPGIVGVDVNPSAVAWCQKLGLPARVMTPDQLPFVDGSFESVVLDNVLEHLETPLPLLREIRRVLVSEGTLVAGVPGRRGYARDPDHKVFYDEQAMVAVIGEAGFRSPRIFHMPFQSQLLNRRLRQYCVYGAFTRG